jgi:hypothetical protein
VSNNLNSFFYNLGKFVKIISKPFLIYLFFIILIVLFPPIENSHTDSFHGWGFINELGGSWRINMVYFLSEIGIVTLVYFAYFLSKKK